MNQSARLLTILSGRVAPLSITRAPGERVEVASGIRKRVVSGGDLARSVALGRLGLAGDEQADLTVHGGLEKAVYAYPAVHYAYWQAWLGRPEALAAGSFGENLLLDGLLETDLWIGDQLQIGDCRLTVTAPRRPCYKLNAVLGNSGVGRETLQRGLTGWYLSVDQTGQLTAGDLVHVFPGPRRVSLPERIRQLTRRADLD